MWCRRIGVIVLALLCLQVCLPKVSRIQDDAGIVTKICRCSNHFDDTNVGIISIPSRNKQGERRMNNVDVIRENQQLSMKVMYCRLCALPNWKSSIRESTLSLAMKASWWRRRHWNQRQSDIQRISMILSALPLSADRNSRSMISGDHKTLTPHNFTWNWPMLNWFVSSSWTVGSFH